MAGPAFPRFTNAICRKPSFSAVDGLRDEDRGAPDIGMLAEEHAQYVAALEAAGVTVQVLEPREAFPDSVFVEDPALVFPEGAILLRPGAPSRAGEVAEIAPVLRLRFPKVLSVQAGFADGGDCLLTPKGVMIGLSERTDEAGAKSLIACLGELGHEGRIVETPPGVLHFKSDCSLIDESTVLTTKRLATSGVFAGFDLVFTADGEEAAANALRVNERLLVGRDYPQTIAALMERGFEVIPMPTSEIAKLDAGLSCMSLRW